MVSLQEIIVDTPEIAEGKLYDEIRKLHAGSGTEDKSYALLSQHRTVVTLKLLQYVTENKKIPIVKIYDPTEVFSSFLKIHPELEISTQSGYAGNTLIGSSFMHHAQQTQMESNKELLVFSLSKHFEPTAFAPTLLGHVKLDDSRYLISEMIEVPTYLQYIRKEGNLEKKMEQFVDTLVEFHGIIGDHLSQMYAAILRSVRRANPAFRPASQREDIYRYRSYWRGLTYGASNKFTLYMEKNGVEEEIKKKDTPEEKKAIMELAFSRFYRENNFEMEPFLEKLCMDHRKIAWETRDELVDMQKKMDGSIEVYNLKSHLRSLEEHYKKGLITIAHRDFNPGNVFVTQGKNVRVCDFQEMRVDDRFVDLVSILYGTWQPEWHGDDYEEFRLNLIKRYVNGVNKRESRLRGRLTFERAVVKCQEDRLMSELRLFSMIPKMRLEKLIPYFKDEDDYSESMLKTAAGRDKLTEGIQNTYRERMEYLLQMLESAKMARRLRRYPFSKQLYEHAIYVHQALSSIQILPEASQLRDKSSGKSRLPTQVPNAKKASNVKKYK